MRRRVLTRDLQTRAPVHKVQHDTVRQLLPVQIRGVRTSEIGQGEAFLEGIAVALRGLFRGVRDGEDEIAGWGEGEEAAFPELL